MYETVHQAMHRLLEIDPVYKFMMHEMFEIGQFIAKFECI